MNRYKRTGVDLSAYFKSAYDPTEMLWQIAHVSSLRPLRNVEYLLLAVMSELSTVRCDCVLDLWLQVHGRRVSTESCRGDAVADGPCGGWRRRVAGTGARAGRQLWRPLLDRGRKHRRMAGFLVCATKPSWRTAVEDAKSWRHGRRFRDWRRNGRRRRLGPRCGRGGDGRRAAVRITGVSDPRGGGGE